jgi:hypothetical protein
MTRSHASRLFLSLAAAVTCAVWSPAAHGQSEAELRRANERLQTRVNDLQRELDNSVAVNEQLRKEIEELRRQLAEARRGGSRGPMPDLPPEKVTIDESKPNASPRALLAAMKKSYNEEMKDLSASEDERLFYRTLRHWVSRVNREYKGKIEWHVRVTDFEPGPRNGVILRLTAIDPVTFTVLGDPFPAYLDRAAKHHLEQEVERLGGFEGQVLVLTGTLIPSARLNENRETAGPFDSPPLIGPYAEFVFDVDARSLVPPEPEKDEDEKDRDRDKPDRGRVDR